MNNQDMQEFNRIYRQILDPALLLNVQEERVLTQMIQKARSEKSKESPDRSVIQKGKEARDQLIQANIFLILHVAKQFSNMQTLTKEDLIQEGFVGLIKAVDTFEPERNFRFDTYAMWVIKNYMINALIEKDRFIHIPAYREKQLRDHFKPTVNRSPEEHAQENNVSQSMLLRVVLSLHAPISSAQDSEVTLENSIIDAKDIADAVSTEITFEHLARIALEALTPLERHIAIALFIEDIAGAEVARHLGVSRMRIIQRKKEIIEKLRHLFTQLGITASDLFN